MDLLDPKEQVPWITFDAFDWLDKWIGPEMSVLEWGTGGSTMYYTKRVRQVVSVEHNPEWHAAVVDALGKSGVKNCDYSLIPPVKRFWARYAPYNAFTCVSRTFEEHRDMVFRGYVRRIDAFPDRSFDLVMVDGRARVACMRRAIRKIKDGGYMMLDNSERDIYQPEMNRMSRKFERTDFMGNGPRLTEQWQTTIWRIRHG